MGVFSILVILLTFGTVVLLIVGYFLDGWVERYRRNLAIIRADSKRLWEQKEKKQLDVATKQAHQTVSKFFTHDPDIPTAQEEFLTDAQAIAILHSSGYESAGTYPPQKLKELDAMIPIPSRESDYEKNERLRKTEEEHKAKVLAKLEKKMETFDGAMRTGYVFEEGLLWTVEHDEVDDEKQILGWRPEAK